MKKKIYTIYMATNIKNNKKYIGVDSNHPYRVYAHKSAVKRGSNLLFHNAIRKHGWVNFEWSVLYQSYDMLHTKNYMEEFFIREYSTHHIDGNGYNMTYGGEGTFGWVPTESTKEKISKSKLGKPSWNKGKKMSPEAVENNRKAQTGLKRDFAKKQYIVTDPDGNVYDVVGLKDFCESRGLHVGNMCSVAVGKLKHYKKWLCSYKDKQIHE